MATTRTRILKNKMLWVLGNYSRFIRPGYYRVSANLNDQESQNRDLLASAYQDPNSGNIVIVLVNSSNLETIIKCTDGQEYPF